MNVVERFAYATGRALGSAAREFLDTMWPPADQRVGTPGKLADIPVPSEGHEWQPVVNDGLQSIDPRWSCSDPGRFTINSVGPQSMDDALAGVDDDIEWFDWARPAIAEVLESGQWVPLEWLDTVSAIIAEKIAADPAKAIAALWNYQLSRNETT